MESAAAVGGSLVNPSVFLDQLLERDPLFVMRRGNNHWVTHNVAAKVRQRKLSPRCIICKMPCSSRPPLGMSGTDPVFCNGCWEIGSSERGGYLISGHPGCRRLVVRESSFVLTALQLLCMNIITRMYCIYLQLPHHRSTPACVFFVPRYALNFIL